MKLITKTAIVFSSVILTTVSAFAEVSKISSENLVQIGQEAFWSADVTCNDKSVRTIQRNADASEWCGKAVSGFCESNKEAAATKICGTEYSSALALVESSKKAKEDAEKARKRAERAEKERADQRRLANERLKQQQSARAKEAAAAAPIKKQITIEEKLITIEQEKLNLRRQELELQKRAVEIEKLLDK